MKKKMDFSQDHIYSVNILNYLKDNLNFFIFNIIGLNKMFLFDYQYQEGKLYISLSVYTPYTQYLAQSLLHGKNSINGY